MIIKIELRNQLNSPARVAHFALDVRKCASLSKLDTTFPDLASMVR